MKVELEQFLIRGDKIIHVPTGAEFRKGDKDILSCDWGTAGESSTSGDAYDRDEVMERACEIFAIQRARPVG